MILNLTYHIPFINKRLFQQPPSVRLGRGGGMRNLRQYLEWRGCTVYSGWELNSPNPDSRFHLRTLCELDIRYRFAKVHSIYSRCKLGPPMGPVGLASAIGQDRAAGRRFALLKSLYIGLLSPTKNWDDASGSGPVIDL